jgi:hypothetical protein
MTTTLKEGHGRGRKISSSNPRNGTHKKPNAVADDNKKEATFVTSLLKSHYIILQKCLLSWSFIT